ncbi:MAG: hypothetical protein CME15_11500 [Gemmatimonadetes bacterium]|jgi:hypothetical protein|nr:hypothetical protein [Gemmatimonadota bacterium]
MDGLNGIAWTDDSQVASLSVTRAGIDRERPRAEVRIDAIGVPKTVPREMASKHPSEEEGLTGLMDARMYYTVEEPHNGV